MFLYYIGVVFRLRGDAIIIRRKNDIKRRKEKKDGTAEIECRDELRARD